MPVVSGLRDMRATGAVSIYRKASIPLGEIKIEHLDLCVSHEQWPIYPVNAALDAG